MNEPSDAGGDSPLVGARLVALFILGILLLNFPLLFLFSGPFSIAGVPLLFVYAFAAWAVLILLLALVVAGARRRRE